MQVCLDGFNSKSLTDKDITSILWHRDFYKIAYLAFEYTFVFCILTSGIFENGILKSNHIYIKIDFRKVVNFILNFTQSVLHIYSETNPHFYFLPYSIVISILNYEQALHENYCCMTTYVTEIWQRS